MKLHYKGKYNHNPDSLPQGTHMPHAVKFKEAEDSKELSLIANIIALVILAVLGIGAYLRYKGLDYGDETFFPVFIISYIASLLCAFPHELLHGICFRKDVYLYTDLKHGMLFVIGPEHMSRGRFVFMSLLPNLVFGFVPYIIGMIYPQFMFFIVWGALNISMGAGDYYNVYNAVTQMPKGARTYLHQFHSYWYMPE